MNEHNEYNEYDELIEPPPMEEDQHLQYRLEVTNLFRKSATHFKVTNAILLLYSWSKLIASFILIYLFLNLLQCQQFQYVSDLKVWTMGLIIHSIIAVFYYSVLVGWMANPRNMNLVAIQLQQTRQQQPIDDIQEQFSREESKRISLLAMQIKYEVQKSNCCGKVIGRLSFLTFQVLFVWGLKIFIQLYGTTVGCETWLFTLLIVILFLGVYQYIDFYLIVVLVILCSPFLLIFGVFYLVSFCKKREQTQHVMDSLDIQNYKPNILMGDAQCSICYSAYEIDEKVVILKCSPVHHFHSDCIQAWLRVQNNCPLCRAEVVADPQEP